MHWIDKAQAISVVSKYMYVLFQCNSHNSHIILSYSNFDFVRDKENRRSLSGYIFTVFGNVISWKANLQYVYAFSATKVEFVACIEVVKEFLWLKGITRQLGIISSVIIDIVFYDN